jgi:hypothetical protein
MWSRCFLEILNEKKERKIENDLSRRYLEIMRFQTDGSQSGDPKRKR